MKKVISLVLILALTVTVVFSVFAEGATTAPLANQEMNCIVGGELTCDDILLLCLASGTPFWICALIWGACKVVVE